MDELVWTARRGRSRETNGENLMLSIKYALDEEQRKAYNNIECFDRDKITIMATAKALFEISRMLEPYVNYYSDGVTKCFGCNLKIIDGEGEEIYIARKIPILSEKLAEEGAEK